MNSPLGQFELKIDSLAFGGDGVARLPDGRTVFISGAAPGDKARVEILQSKKTYAKARVVEVMEPGPDRVAAPCPVFGTCGGCQWQHLSYASQLKAKQGFVVEALKRIGGIAEPPVRPIIGCDDPYHYRNKATLPAAGGRLGFYREGSHEIVELPETGCAIQSEGGNRALVALRAELEAIPGLKHVAVRTDSKGRALLVLVSAAPLSLPGAEGWLKKAEGLVGVVNNLQPSSGNAVFGPENRVMAGQGHLDEELGGHKFRLSGTSFFQVNGSQTLKMWDVLKKAREWKGSERVLELYCGVGTLSLPLAALSGSLLGVELHAPAVEDARVNAQVSGASNIRFEAGDAMGGFTMAGEVDVLALDPPRKGLDEGVIVQAGELAIPEILYVSCDPASLARDAARLKLAGYRLDFAQPLDMFPQTYHVETVASFKLEKKP